MYMKMYGRTEEKLHVFYTSALKAMLLPAFNFYSKQRKEQ
jgi:hypothetical protein